MLITKRVFAPYDRELNPAAWVMLSRTSEGYHIEVEHRDGSRAIIATADVAEAWAQYHGLIEEIERDRHGNE